MTETDAAAATSEPSTVNTAPAVSENEPVASPDAAEAPPAQSGGWLDFSGVASAAVAAGGFLSTKASEAHAAAQPHVAAAGDYISTKAGEAAVATKEGTLKAVDATKEGAVSMGGYVATKTTDVAVTVGEHATAAGGYVQDYVQEKASDVASAASGRMETTKAAKTMIDEGGQAVEDRLVAKQSAVTAVTLESAAIANLKEASAKLRESEAQLRGLSAAKEPAADGEAPEFGEHVAVEFADMYGERAKKIEDFLQSLGTDLLSPELSAVEADALRLLAPRLALRQVAAQGGGMVNMTKEDSQSNVCPPPDDLKNDVLSV